MQQHREHLILIGIALAVIVLWPYAVLAPLKLLIVFFHESSHALATVATGGEVVEMVVNANQGGHVLSRGGNRFLTLTSGYIGSLFWGVVIYLSALLSRWDQAILSVLAFLILGIAAFFIRDVFALVFSIGVAVVMLATAKWLPHIVSDLVLRLIGITSMLYVPLDIYSDTISRSHLRSDAFMLGEEFGGPGWLWGGLWLIFSVFVVFITLKFGHGNAGDEPVRDI